MRYVRLKKFLSLFLITVLVIVSSIFFEPLQIDAAQRKDMNFYTWPTGSLQVATGASVIAKPTVAPQVATGASVVIKPTGRPQVATGTSVVIKPTGRPQIATASAIVVTSAGVLCTGAAVTTGSVVPFTTPNASDFSTMWPVVVPTSTIAPNIKPTAIPNSTEYIKNEQNTKKNGEEYDVYQVENEKDTLQEGDSFEIKSVIYEVTDASDTPTVELVTIEKKNLKLLSVPAIVKYKGVTYKVTGIAKGAFKNSKKLTSLTIGKNVTYIGSYAFYKNSKLKKITIKSLKLKKIQKKAFWGLSKKVTVKLPVSKKANYKEMLKNAGLGK